MFSGFRIKLGCDNTSSVATINEARIHNHQMQMYMREITSSIYKLPGFIIDVYDGFIYGIILAFRGKQCPLASLPSTKSKKRLIKYQYSKSQVPNLNELYHRDNTELRYATDLIHLSEAIIKKANKIPLWQKQVLLKKFCSWIWDHLKREDKVSFWKEENAVSISFLYSILLTNS